MGHTITVADILLALCMVGGLAGVAIGLLMTFAGGMSDAPVEGQVASRQGCITALVGAVVLGASLFGLIN
jgi:hypothetical protein